MLLTFLIVASASGAAAAGKNFFNWILLPVLVVSAAAALLFLLWQNTLFNWVLVLLALFWSTLYFSPWWGLVRFLWRKELPELLKFSTRYLFKKHGITFHGRLLEPIAIPPTPPDGAVIAVRSCRGTGERFAVLPPVTFEEGHTVKGEASIVINTSVKFQKFMGFGTALTESCAKVLKKMSSAKQEKIIDAYFKKGTGLGFNIGRLHFNSCDFSDGNWACNDKKGGKFSIDRYKEDMLPLVRNANKAAGESLTLFASPWSPPAWMKDNGKMCAGGKLKPECRADWAEQYVLFAKAFQEAGLPLWGFSMQNEPDAVTPWENCLYSAEEERDFIRDYLGPALEKSGLDLKLIAWDHNRDELFLRAHRLYSDEKAAKYVWGMGWHWYGDPRHEWWPEDAGMVCFDNVRRVHELRPDKHLLVTETCQEVGPHIGDWTVAERYAESIIKDFNNWCEGWVDWNMILDENGGPNHVGNECSAPIIVHTVRDEVLLNPSYYAFGHFSRHIQPGAERVLCGASRDNLEATAWLNPDGTISLVVLNQTAFAKDFCIVIGGRVARVQGPAHSITTFLLPKGVAG